MKKSGKKYLKIQKVFFNTHDKSFKKYKYLLRIEIKRENQNQKNIYLKLKKKLYRKKNYFMIYDFISLGYPLLKFL